MNIKDIKEILELMTEHQIAEVELEKGDMKLKLSKNSSGQIVAAQPQVVSAAPVAPATGPTPVPAAESPAPAADDPNVVVVKAPMVGTFYSAPAPDQPAFVSVGSSVSEGDVLCILEAMKLMNEIKADLSGSIVEILVENGQAIEYDQPIFKIKKS